MNWKLLFQMSILGLAMAFGTVSLIPWDVEVYFWIPIFILCAVVIARRCKDRLLFHGVMLILFNAIWYTGVHLLLYPDYIANHPEWLTLIKDSAIQNHPRVAMLVGVPLIGIALGLIQGIMALIASRILLQEAAAPKSAHKKAKAKA